MLRVTPQLDGGGCVRQGRVVSKPAMRESRCRFAKDGKTAVKRTHRLGNEGIVQVMEPVNFFGLGSQRTRALRLFEKQQLTLAQAAELAAVSTEEFMALAGAAGVVVVDYPAEELREEMAAALPRQ